MEPKIITTMRSYSKAAFVGDVTAGLTVAMVAMPLSLAIAIASGVGPEKGLITAIVGGFLISLLGGSRVQIGGPTGAFIVIVYGVIQEHGFDGLILATFMAGLILILAGYLRLGRLITFVPEAVVSGFTAGIAIIIAASQLKDFLGLSTSALPADFLPKMGALWTALNTFQWQATLVALVTIVLIVLIRRISLRIPGPLIAIGVASALSMWLVLPVPTIQSVFGDLPHSLPKPHLAELSYETMKDLLPSAMVIAFLAALESLLSAIVSDNMIGGSHRSNAEVFALGAANVGSALFGGLPATGAIARTATNVRAGGRTPVAGMVHSLTILAILYFASGIAGEIAMPAMAGLLMLVSWNMAEPRKCVTFLATPGQRSERLLFLITMVLTVVVDLTFAIGVGVSIGLAMRARNRNLPRAKWRIPRRFW